MWEILDEGYFWDINDKNNKKHRTSWPIKTMRNLFGKQLIVLRMPLKDF